MSICICIWCIVILFSTIFRYSRIGRILIFHFKFLMQWIRKYIFFCNLLICNSLRKSVDNDYLRVRFAEYNVIRWLFDEYNVKLTDMISILYSSTFPKTIRSTSPYALLVRRTVTKMFIAWTTSNFIRFV